MSAIHLPSFETVEAALDWLHSQGDVVRVCLMLGNDGMVRGTALVRQKEAA
jgi:hypothetical protein